MRRFSECRDRKAVICRRISARCFDGLFNMNSRMANRGRRAEYNGARAFACVDPNGTMSGAQS